MSRRKLLHFADNAKSENVIEPGKEIFNQIKNNWQSFFKNTNPIVFEIGCGRAEYTTGMAVLFPNKNFVGVDLKGNRLWKGSNVSNEKGLTNTAFLRIMIQNLLDFVGKQEGDEVWITFPDPRPKEGEQRLRLTSPRYLKMYKKILKPGSWVHLKTDSEDLYLYTLSLLKPDSEYLKTGDIKVADLEYTDNLYDSNMRSLAFDIQTTFEGKYLKVGETIKFIRFRIF